MRENGKDSKNRSMLVTLASNLNSNHFKVYKCVLTNFWVVSVTVNLKRIRKARSVE